MDTTIINSDGNIHNKHNDISNTSEENQTDDGGGGIDLRILGQKISTIRKLLNLTQAEFAETLGITGQTLSLVENGKFDLTNNLASKIYFSLSEIINDNELCELINLNYIQKMAITDLSEDLINFVRVMNSGLKKHMLTISKSENIESKT